MQLRILLFFASLLTITSGLRAQDKIFKTNGEIIDAKVKNVGVRTVVYTRFDNQSGPEYTIVKREVERIKYQNGSEDIFEPDRPFPRPRHSRAEPSGPQVASQQDPKMKYGPNLIAIAPMQFTENGLGISISYERILDKAGYVAVSIPVVATFNLNNANYYNNVTQTTQNGHVDGMYYLMPGLKIYPTTNAGLLRYSIGPSIVAGVGQKSSSTFDPYGNSIYQTQTHDILGVMINNSLNISPTPHIYLGIDFGLGFSYLNQVGGVNQNTNVLVQGSMKVGYRF